MVVGVRGCWSLWGIAVLPTGVVVGLPSVVALSLSLFCAVLCSRSAVCHSSLLCGCDRMVVCSCVCRSVSVSVSVCLCVCVCMCVERQLVMLYGVHSVWASILLFHVFCCVGMPVLFVVCVRRGSEERGVRSTLGVPVRPGKGGEVEEHEQEHEQDPGEGEEQEEEGMSLDPECGGDPHHMKMMPLQLSPGGWCGRVCKGRETPMELFRAHLRERFGCQLKRQVSHTRGNARTFMCVESCTQLRWTSACAHVCSRTHGSLYIHTCY